MPGIDHLKRLKDLEVINLYRTKVSNAGLDKLKEFTRLREVDLRYSRATGAGVADLQKALPDTRLVFLDFSLRAADEGKAANAPEGGSEEAVADWVRSLGGTATLDSGRPHGDFAGFQLCYGRSPRSSSRSQRAAQTRLAGYGGRGSRRRVAKHPRDARRTEPEQHPHFRCRTATPGLA